MKFTRRIMLASTMALGLSSGLSGAVSAAETINMTAIDGYPERSMWVKEFSGFFIPRVNEELAVSGNYKINWLEAYGGQIVKPRGVLEGIKLGLGDIGIVTTIFRVASLRNRRNRAAVGQVIALCVCIGFGRLAQHIVGIAETLGFHLCGAHHRFGDVFTQNKLTAHFLHRPADGGPDNGFTQALDRTAQVTHGTRGIVLQHTPC